MFLVSSLLGDSPENPAQDGETLLGLFLDPLCGASASQNEQKPVLVPPSLEPANHPPHPPVVFFFNFK